MNMNNSLDLGSLRLELEKQKQERELLKSVNELAIIKHQNKITTFISYNTKKSIEVTITQNLIPYYWTIKRKTTSRDVALTKHMIKLNLLIPYTC